MPASTTTVEQIINSALDECGWPESIANIYEGSRQARIALRCYTQERDELLRERNWDFARRANVALELLKGPPPPGGYNPSQPWTSDFPPPGWLYEYGYPADALRILALFPRPFLWPDRDPKPVVWREDNDKALGEGSILIGQGGAVLTGAGGAILVGRSVGDDPNASGTKVILANIPNALAVYRAQVADPVQWNVGFIDALVSRISGKLSVALRDSTALMGIEEQQGAREGLAAERRPG